jgi:VanZ family protein
MNRFLRVHGPSIAYALCIFIFSSIPSLKSPDLGVSFEDKIYHVLEYMGLGILLQRGSAMSGGRSLKRILSISILGLCYGASDEIHQLFVPGRQCDGFDFLADAAGFITGQALFIIFRARFSTGKKNI